MLEREGTITVRADKFRESLLERWGRKFGGEVELSYRCQAIFLTPQGEKEFEAFLAGISAVDLIFVSSPKGSINADQPGWIKTNRRGSVILKEADYYVLVGPQDVSD